MGEDSESLDKLFSCLSLSFLICEMGTIIYVGQLAKALWPYWIADCLLLPWLSSLFHSSRWFHVVGSQMVTCLRG